MEITPISPLTVAVAALGVLVSLLVSRPLARRTGWSPAWTLVSLALGVSTLALTLLPGGARGPGGLRSCVRAAASGEGLLTNFSAADTALNLILLVPLGFAVVLATRRVAPGLLVVLVLPGLIELTQTQVPGRVCSGVDYATNVVGGTAGVVAAGVVLAAAWTLRRVRRVRR